MANQIYGYGGTGLSTVYSSRTATDPYLPDSSYMAPSRFLTSDAFSSYDSSMYSAMDRGAAAASMYLNHNDGGGFKYNPGSDIGRYGGFSASRASGGNGMGGGAAIPTSTTSSLTQTSWPGVDGGAGFDPVMAGVKRSNEALYHQTYLGTNNTFGQSEALFSANSLGKRSRFESTSNLPIYPQRPGEKDCAHYMHTRTCKFGESCKFDHPVWVPEGGIADWKEVPLVAASESLPVRLGEPDCPYFLKTQKCKFGIRCKFNHPNYKTESVVLSATVDVSGLPERPSEPLCAFYMKTGICKFGASCKFHHPKDIQVSLTQQENGNEVQTESGGVDDGKTTGDVKPVQPFAPFTPASLHNSKGLPVRLGEVDCPFYIKTGSCKYGATCRYNHPDRNDFCAAISPAVAGGIGHIIASTGASMNVGVLNPAASILPSFDPRLAQTTIGLGSTIYPQRPGQIECDFYMKTGDCKFGERCKFHHPIDRSAPIPSMTKQALQQNVKLTLAGLPRREGAIICPFYMKTATCKYGVTCRFDHPPPGEAIAMATVQGASASVDAEGDQGTETDQEQQHPYLP